MKKRDIITLISAILICEGVGMAGGICTSQSIPVWYRTLDKPSFNPPSWVFAPVWTILYALMGIAISIIYQKKEQKNAPLAIIVFSIQLAQNLLWSVLFFCMRTPLGAFIEIFFLWGMILLTILLFWNISKKAALLLVPYLLWVSFASVLNFEVWRLNR
jgi:translocator protein